MSGKEGGLNHKMSLHSHTPRHDKDGKRQTHRHHGGKNGSKCGGNKPVLILSPDKICLSTLLGQALSKMSFITRLFMSFLPSMKVRYTIQRKAKMILTLHQLLLLTLLQWERKAMKPELAGINHVIQSKMATLVDTWDLILTDENVYWLLKDCIEILFWGKVSRNISGIFFCWCSSKFGNSPLIVKNDLVFFNCVCVTRLKCDIIALQWPRQ